MSELISSISNQTLPVMEHFYTIQGEGFHQGRSAYFIRLGGCDVGCVWCDVKESWDHTKHPQILLENIVDYTLKAKSEIVVITGGEPLMYNLDALTNNLRLKGLHTHIETSGAHAMSGQWNWVCLSPKKFKTPLSEIYPSANELKVIIYNNHDFEWAEQHAALVNNNCYLYLQPEWSKEKTMLPLIIEYVKQNPKWRISLQVHKYMNIP